VALAIGGSALLYGALLFATKAVTREELAKMPKGTKILKLVDAFRRK